MIDPQVVRVTRKRTADMYATVAANSFVPTVVLDLLSVLIQRLDDLEEAAGYVSNPSEALDAALAAMSKVDTQGR